MINQQTKLAQKNLNTRVKSSIYIVLYLLLIFALSIFSDPQSIGPSGWLSPLGIPNYVLFSLAIILVLSSSWMCYMFARELDNCFLKTKSKKIIWFIAISILIIELAPTIVYLLPVYGIAYYGKSNDTQFLVYIFIGMTICLPAFFFFVFLFLICHLKNKNHFNIMIFPTLTIFLGLFLLWMNYILICKGWTTFIFLMAIVVLTDIMAYFGGTIFGKHKLCPKISPKKTIEGFVIGFILTIAVVYLLTYIYSIDTTHNILYNILGFQYIKEPIQPNLDPMWWFYIGLFIAFFSLVTTYGDLQFSIFKRMNKIKDFSNFIPGHGGLLDRVDSLSATISVYGVLSFFITWGVTGSGNVFGDLFSPEALMGF